MINRRGVRVAVYVALVGSAIATFLWGDRLWDAVRAGSLPFWVAILPAVLFTVFVGVYALDRWVQVRRRQHRVGWALIQVAGAVAFLTLLWPDQAEQMKEMERQRSVVAEGDHAARLLRHADADARATACEVLSLRPVGAGDGELRLALTALVDGDPAPTVRQFCSKALARMSERPAE